MAGAYALVCAPALQQQPQQVCAMQQRKPRCILCPPPLEQAHNSGTTLTFEHELAATDGADHDRPM